MDARDGLIYIMRAGERAKIGWCAGDVEKRRAELQTGCPDPLEVLVTFAGTRADEAALHARFAALRARGEWFRYDETLVGFVAQKRPPVRTTKRSAPSSARIPCVAAVGPGSEDPSPFHLSLPEEHPAMLSVRPVPWDRVDAEREHKLKGSPLDDAVLPPIPAPGRDVLLIVRLHRDDVPQIAIRLEPPEVDLLVEVLGGQCGSGSAPITPANG